MDGATIGSTGVCSAEDYERVIAAATEAGKHGAKCPHPNGAKSSASTEKHCVKHKDALGALVSL